MAYVQRRSTVRYPVVTASRIAATLDERGRQCVPRLTRSPDVMDAGFVQMTG